MKFIGLDPILLPIPIRPVAHYSMGGIDVDINGSTILNGLYAAGECACISVHGANRLGGNSLLETVVFGRLTAEHIVDNFNNIDPDNVLDGEEELKALKSAIQEIDSKIEKILGRKGDENLFTIGDHLTKTMYGQFGIYRDERNMREGYAAIKKMQVQLSRASPDNPDRRINQALIRFLELEGMLQLAEVTACVALARKESRGSHKRIDYPERDDARFLKHSITKLEGKLQISHQPVKLGMFKPEERKY